MISLFHIPTHVIDTSRFSSLLHDKIVREFEERFAEYVGAKYAVSLHSATAGIMISFLGDFGTEVGIPSILPPVVANALTIALCTISFEDNVDWVGGSYILHEWADCKFIDSAHKVEKDQYKKESTSDKDMMLFSFYPTKPISSCDGGMIVSNDKDSIETIRTLANNGMQALPPLEGAGREVGGEVASWQKIQTTIGHKLYMNSISAYIAMKNMDNLQHKKERLDLLRYEYNRSFGLNNTSEHLYRVLLETTDNRSFIAKAREAGIECGIHYDALHHNPIFGYDGPELPMSDLIAKHTVSIPYHEMLDYYEVSKVIEFVKRNR